MSEEPPKLYANKPKKAQVKQFQEQHKVKEASSPVTPTPSAAAASNMASQSSSSPPLPPKESFVRRYKFLWPMLLTVNLAVGAYLLMRTKKEDNPVEEKAAATTDSVKASATTPAIVEPLPTPVIVEPVKVREPIPVDQQRELFKWVLEEKRKMKPKDTEEKKRIDEEKAILKQFIRAKSIPDI